MPVKTISFLFGLVMCCVTSALAQPSETNPVVVQPLPKRAPRVGLDTAAAVPVLPADAPKASPIAVTTTKPVQTTTPVPTNFTRVTAMTPSGTNPSAVVRQPPTLPIPKPVRTNSALSGKVPPSPGATPAAVPAIPATPPAFPTPVAPTPLPTNPSATASAPARGGGGTNSAAIPGGAGTPDILPAGLIKFQDADVFQVLELYQELTGRTVLRPANLTPAKISIRTQTQLTREEAIRALDSILSLNGIIMSPQGDKFVKAVVQQQMNSTGQKFNYEDPSKLPEAGSPVWQIVRITNSLPGEVAKALAPFASSPASLLAIDPANVLIIRDTAENVKRMMELIEKIDVVPVDEIQSVVIPIKYALAGDIAEVLSSLTAGGGGATRVGRQQTRAGLTGGSGGGFGGGFGGGAGGMSGYPGSSMGGMQGMQGYNTMGGSTMGGLSSGGLSSQRAGQSSFSQRLNSLVAKASGSADIVVLQNTKIIADERTNSLLIYASRQDLKSISNIISQLDVVLAQVLIEALIFEVSLNKSLDYGISYLQTSPSQINSFSGIGAINNGTFLNPNAFKGGANAVGGTNGLLSSGFSYFGRFGNDLDVTATAIANDSRFNVLSRPRIQTSHAVEANLFVGRTRPYPTGTSYGGVYGGNYNSIQQLQIGITLSVLPLINPDGLVVMDIRQRTQSVGNEIDIANVGKVPETIDREANAKVAVKNRETIVLGGFISSEKKKSISGVPLLMDIPILGNFFRSTSKSQDRQELMILIRPTVLPTPTNAAELVAEEKGNMPGIAAADRDFQDMEAKRRNAEYKEEAKRLYSREGFKE